MWVIVNYHYIFRSYLLSQISLVMLSILCSSFLFISFKLRILTSWYVSKYCNSALHVSNSLIFCSRAYTTLWWSCSISRCIHNFFCKEWFSNCNSLFFRTEVFNFCSKVEIISTIIWHMFSAIYVDSHHKIFYTYRQTFCGIDVTHDHHFSVTFIIDTTYKFCLFTCGYSI